MAKTETPNRIPLASFQWLKYLGIVFLILSIYTVGICYYRFGDDIFPVSLTVAQHVKLSLLSIGSMLSELLYPLLFFSGALLYRTLRLKEVNPVSALRRDLFVLVPLGIVLWFYGAYGQEPVSRGFYVMIFDIQSLEPGQKLVQDPADDDLLALPDLNGLYDKVDTLDSQIKSAEDRFIGHIKSLCSPSQIDDLYRQLDFGSSSIKLEDLHGSENTWDGVQREFGYLAAGARSQLEFIDSLRDQQNRFRDEIMVIHFTPFYVLLFLIFGLLLGYLILLNIPAFTAILLIIGFCWYYGTTLLETTLDPFNSNQFAFVLGKIEVLLVINTILIFLAIKVHQRSKEKSRL